MRCPNSPRAFGGEDAGRKRTRTGTRRRWAPRIAVQVILSLHRAAAGPISECGCRQTVTGASKSARVAPHSGASGPPPIQCTAFGYPAARSPRALACAPQRVPLLLRGCACLRLYIYPRPCACRIRVLCMSQCALLLSIRRVPPQMFRTEIQFLFEASNEFGRGTHNSSPAPVDGPPASGATGLVLIATTSWAPKASIHSPTGCACVTGFGMGLSHLHGKTQGDARIGIVEPRTWRAVCKKHVLLDCSLNREDTRRQLLICSLCMMDTIRGLRV